MKKTFSINERMNKGILEILHSNVCGPMSSSSLSGYVYYVSCMDDFSCKTWIYFLKGKSEVFSNFKEHKAFVENDTVKKIKILQSDNGGKFTSEEFKELYRESGIKR